MLGPPPHPVWVQNAQIPGDTGGNAQQCRPGKRELTQLKLRAGGTRSKSALQTQCNAAFMRHKSPQKGIKGGSSCHQRSRCIRSLQSVPGPRRSQAPSVPDPLQVQPSRGTPRRVPARPRTPRCPGRQDAHPGSAEARCALATCRGRPGREGKAAAPRQTHLCRGAASAAAAGGAAAGRALAGTWCSLPPRQRAVCGVRAAGAPLAAPCRLRPAPPPPRRAPPPRRDAPRWAGPACAARHGPRCRRPGERGPRPARLAPYPGGHLRNTAPGTAVRAAAQRVAHAALQACARRPMAFAASAAGMAAAELTCCRLARGAGIAARARAPLRAPGFTTAGPGPAPLWTRHAGPALPS